jgi:HSP20 family protein
VKVQYRYVSYGAGHDTVEQMQQVHHLLHHMLARVTPGIAGTWQPPADIYETDDALVVQLELAGVREEDITATLFADHLEVAGTRRHHASPGAAYHLAGILYGDFRLAIPVLASLRRDAVEASYDNGLLTIVLPKATERIEPISIQPAADQVTSG